jgi:hypothetical protein
MQRDSEMGSSSGSYCVDRENRIEPAGSLPRSPEPATCSYPQPGQSSPFHSYPIPLPEGPS